MLNDPLFCSKVERDIFESEDYTSMAVQPLAAYQL